MVGSASADGTSVESDGKTGFFASIRVRLIVWTVQYILLAEAVLFVILLAEFERDHLTQAAREAHLIGVSQAWMEAIVVTEEEVLQLRETLDEISTVSGLQPIRYRVWANGEHPANLGFTFAPTLRSDDVENLIDLADLNLATRALNALGRLLWTDPARLVVVNNAQAFLENPGDLSEPRIEIVSLAMDSDRLRGATLDFIGAFLLQALALVLAVSVLMYVSARQIVAPLRRMRQTLARLAENPIRESANTAVQVSTIGEIQEAGVEVGKLKQSIREEGVRAFLNYRGDVEHDLKDFLIMQGEVAKEIGRTADADVREDLIEQLADMHNDTQEFLRDIFEFLSPEHKDARLDSVDLGELCDELLRRNIHLFMEGEPQYGAVIANMLCAKARADVPADLTVMVNKAALKSVLDNLIWNSVKAFRKNPDKADQSDWPSNLLEIRARKDSDSVVIVVRDNGPGLGSKSKDGMDASGKTETKERRSWGIGLEIVRDRIKDMGGTLEISDRPSPPRGSKTAGAEIRMVLPYIQAEDSE